MSIHYKENMELDKNSTEKYLDIETKKNKRHNKSISNILFKDNDLLNKMVGSFISKGSNSTNSNLNKSKNELGYSCVSFDIDDDDDSYIQISISDSNLDYIENYNDEYIDDYIDEYPNSFEDEDSIQLSTFSYKEEFVNESDDEVCKIEENNKDTSLVNKESKDEVCKIEENNKDTSLLNSVVKVDRIIKEIKEVKEIKEIKEIKQVRKFEEFKEIEEDIDLDDIYVPSDFENYGYDDGYDDRSGFMDYILDFRDKTLDYSKLNQTLGEYNDFFEYFDEEKSINNVVSCDLKNRNSLSDLDIDGEENNSIDPFDKHEFLKSL